MPRTKSERYNIARKIAEKLELQQLAFNEAIEDYISDDQLGPYKNIAYCFMDVSGTDKARENNRTFLNRLCTAEGRAEFISSGMNDILNLNISDLCSTDPDRILDCFGADPSAFILAANLSFIKETDQVSDGAVKLFKDCESFLLNASTLLGYVKAMAQPEYYTGDYGDLSPLGADENRMRVITSHRSINQFEQVSRSHENFAEKLQQMGFTGSTLKDFVNMDFTGKLAGKDNVRLTPNQVYSNLKQNLPVLSQEKGNEEKEALEQLIKYPMKDNNLLAGRDRISSKIHDAAIKYTKDSPVYKNLATDEEKALAIQAAENQITNGTHPLVAFLNSHPEFKIDEVLDRLNNEDNVALKHFADVIKADNDDLEFIRKSSGEMVSSVVAATLAPKVDSTQAFYSFNLNEGELKDSIVEKFKNAQTEMENLPIDIPEGFTEEDIEMVVMSTFLSDDVARLGCQKILDYNGPQYGGSTLHFTNEVVDARSLFFQNLMGSINDINYESRTNLHAIRLAGPEARRRAQQLITDYINGDPKPLLNSLNDLIEKLVIDNKKALSFNKEEYAYRTSSIKKLVNLFDTVTQNCRVRNRLTLPTLKEENLLWLRLFETNLDIVKEKYLLKQQIRNYCLSRSCFGDPSVPVDNFRLKNWYAQLYAREEYLQYLSNSVRRLGMVEYALGADVVAKGDIYQDSRTLLPFERAVLINKEAFFENLSDKVKSFDEFNAALRNNFNTWNNYFYRLPDNRSLDVNPLSLEVEAKNSLLAELRGLPKNLKDLIKDSDVMKKTIFSPQDNEAEFAAHLQEYEGTLSTIQEWRNIARDANNLNALTVVSNFYDITEQTIQAIKEERVNLGIVNELYKSVEPENHSFGPISFETANQLAKEQKAAQAKAIENIQAQKSNQANNEVGFEDYRLLLSQELASLPDSLKNDKKFNAAIKSLKNLNTFTGSASDLKKIRTTYDLLDVYHSSLEDRMLSDDTGKFEAMDSKVLNIMTFLDNLELEAKKPAAKDLTVMASTGGKETAQKLMHASAKLLRSIDRTFEENAFKQELASIIVCNRYLSDPKLIKKDPGFEIYDSEVSRQINSPLMNRLVQDRDVITAVYELRDLELDLPGALDMTIASLNQAIYKCYSDGLQQEGNQAAQNDPAPARPNNPQI